MKAWSNQSYLGVTVKRSLYRDIVSLRIGQIMEEKSQESPTDINDAEFEYDSLNPAGDSQLKGTYVASK